MVAFDKRRNMHCVAYDAGEKSWHDLSQKQVTVLAPGVGTRDDAPLAASTTTPLSLAAYYREAHGLGRSKKPSKLASPQKEALPKLEAVYGEAAVRR